MSLSPKHINWEDIKKRNTETSEVRQEPEKPKSLLSQIFGTENKVKVPWFTLGMAASHAKETALLKKKREREKELGKKK